MDVCMIRTTSTIRTTIMQWHALQLKITYSLEVSLPFLYHLC